MFFIFCIFTIFACLTGLVYADDVEFNTDVLDVGERNNISLSQFSHPGYLMPGEYSFVIHVNGQALNGERKIKYYDDNKTSRVCVPKDIVQELGVKSKYMNKLTWWHEGECLNLSSLDGMTAKGNLSNSSLVITVPQAYMDYVSENWDPPSRWDHGVAGLIFDYNVSAQAGRNISEYSDGKYYDISGNGTTGFNAGAWRFRGDWQGRIDHSTENSNSGSRDFSFSQIYAYRPLPSVQSKLTAGETYYNSDVFDSFRFIGALIESDDNMLPPGLRGYAPEVTGVAKTNARVTVSQKGRVLYQTQVAPGPFRIQDLNDAVSGELNVEIREQGGEVKSFTVTTSDIPYLTRPGTVRYKMALGKPEGYRQDDSANENVTNDSDTWSDIHRTYDADMFASGEFSWGVSSGWSLYGGAINSKDYNAFSLGAGRDLLQFGAVALDGSIARARLPFKDEASTGSSYRLSYSKNFDEYDSQITFAGYRFSTKDFMTMDEYLDALGSGSSVDNDKQMYTVTFNKQFRDTGLSVYLNYSHKTYWGSPEDNNFNLSVSKNFDEFGFKNINVSMTAYKNQYNGTDDHGCYLSISLPVGENSTVSLNSSYGGGSSSNEMSYYHTIDENNNYELAVGGADGDATGRAYFTHLGDMAEIDASADYQNGTSRSLGVTLRGGLTATRYGMALHRSVTMGGTRMMLDTDGVSDVPIKDSDGIIHTNIFGKTVIGGINSYYRTSVNIDLDHLDNHVDAINSVVQDTLTEGAIGYRKFSVLSGEKSMAILRLEDGTSPPFGATVFNDKGLQTGIVDDDGNVYLSGIQPDANMTVKWASQACNITLPTNLKATSSEMLLLPCTASR